MLRAHWRNMLSRLRRKRLSSPLNGRPTAAVVAIPNTDLETVALSSNPKFLALIAQSRAQQQTEGGVNADVLRQRLGLPPRHP